MDPRRSILLDGWAAVTNRSAVAAGAGSELLERWGEPWRRYHTVDHLLAVLGHLRSLGEEEPATLLAAWYHDAVYRPDRTDNEAASARLARSTIIGLGLGAELADETARLVLLTTDHQVSAGDRAGQLLCDADLAVLGCAPSSYAAYRRAVREEYPHLDDAAWRQGRARVLRTILDRPHVFSSPAGRNRWETAARSNMQSELAVLTAPET